VDKPSPGIFESLTCVSSRNDRPVSRIRPGLDAGIAVMLMLGERRPTYRTLEGWAVGVLLEAGAVHECEPHGHVKDRADPHAWDRAVSIARQDHPEGVSPDQAVAAIHDVLGSIGDTCPECS
jgi:hypothetical protein